MSQSNEMEWPPWLARPPSVDELVTDDGEPLESNRHRLQMTLLIETLELAWAGRNDFFAGGNMFLYYSAVQAQTKKNDFRGPDVFVVLDTERRDRKAWVIWEEDGRAPDVIIELTSDSTRDIDHGPKKHIYGTLVRVSDYFIFDPFSAELEGFRLNMAQFHYEPLEFTQSGRLPSRRLGLELGRWQGRYADVDATWLRWYTPDGKLLPTPREAHSAAEQERARAEQERARAEQDKARAEQERARAEQDKARAEQEKARVEQDKARIEKERWRLAERVAEYERRYGALPDDK